MQLQPDRDTHAINTDVSLVSDHSNISVAYTPERYAPYLPMEPTGGDVDTDNADGDA